ncbi:amidase, partial [Streptomyces varsoviensis]
MTSLADLTALQLLAGYGSGAFSPVEVVRANLARIEEAPRGVNAFTRVAADAALREAEAAASRWLRAEPSGLLDGVPVTVKDLLLMRGEP